MGVMIEYIFNDLIYVMMSQFSTKKEKKNPI